MEELGSARVTVELSGRGGTVVEVVDGKVLLLLSVRTDRASVYDWGWDKGVEGPETQRCKLGVYRWDKEKGWLWSRMNGKKEKDAGRK